MRGQNREDLTSIMNEYVENYGKSNYGHEFVDSKLNPALELVETSICENGDEELFTILLNMILATKGSADETPANVLGGLFICDPSLVETKLGQPINDEYLLELLEFGFKNRTFGKIDQMENYKELEQRLNLLLN